MRKQLPWLSFNKNPNSRSEVSVHGIVEALMSALDARECETQRHSERVAQYTRFLAEKMGVEGDELENIYRGALLHDIGKIGVPDAVLLKRASLTEAEWKIMKKHPEIGWEILLNVEVLKSSAEIVLTHEERFDGSGYPRGLRGKQIPLGARIFALMDTLDAMASDRPYRKAMPFPLIEAEIIKGKGTQFDPEVVEVFRQYVYSFEERVRWEDKKPCIPYWEQPIKEELDRLEKTVVMDLV